MRRMHAVLAAGALSVFVSQPVLEEGLYEKQKGLFCRSQAAAKYIVQMVRAHPLDNEIRVKMFVAILQGMTVPWRTPHVVVHNKALSDWCEWDEKQLMLFPYADVYAERRGYRGTVEFLPQEARRKSNPTWYMVTAAGL